MAKGNGFEEIWYRNCFADMAPATAVAIFVPVPRCLSSPRRSEKSDGCHYRLSPQGVGFPPEITPPTFIWRDPDEAANRWRIDVVFADGSPETRFESRGEPFHIAEID
jgi:hypothetical protein